jgi:hypothetical protein
VAVLACGTCLSSLAAGLTGLLAGVVGAVWAQWLPAALLLGAIAAWIGGVFEAPRRQLRCE